jgi:WD40 repeat protein
LAINYYPSNLTQLLDLERLSLVTSVEPPQWGGNVAFSPGGNYLALGGDHLALHAAPEGRLLATDKAFGNNIADVRFTPQGDLLLVSAYDGKVRSYALPAGDVLPERLPSPQLLRHAGTANVYGLGLSRDGRLLVTPSGDKTLKIWVR